MLPRLDALHALQFLTKGAWHLFGHENIYPIMSNSLQIIQSISYNRRVFSDIDKLARENAAMEERLNGLRTQLEVQRQKYRTLRRVSSAGIASTSKMVDTTNASLKLS